MKAKAIKWLNSLVTESTTKGELDIIEFIRKCVKNYKVEDKNKENEEYITELFEKFYKVYIRKGAKIQASKTFRKKLIKLKTKEEILEKARKIAKVYSVCAKEWNENGRDKQFIPLCSSFLNSNIPD